MSKRKTKDEFIKDAISKHGNAYSYDNVKYINANTLVDIICPKHGLFPLTPHDHLKGQGCKWCGIERRANKRKLTLTDFISKANKIHTNKYNYDLVDYKDYKTEVKIICPIHGEFTESPQNHLQGCGCKECAKEYNSKLFSDTREEFITKAINVHGNKYDYSLVEYKGSKVDVDIICPKHGVFQQKPNHHLSGSGCPKCSNGSSLPEDEIIKVLKNADKMQSKEEYIKKCKLVHNNKYNYENVFITRMKDYITIICPIHGEFWQTPSNHLRGEGCPICANSLSHCENEICECLKELVIEQRNRKILGGKEIDIYIPQYKIGIEFNGLYWHSEENGKDENYHLSKLNECNQNGVELIQIFEDEWVNHRDVCEFLIKDSLGLNTSKIVKANECIVRENVNEEEVTDFLETNSINGGIISDITINAYYNNTIVGVMTLTKNNNQEYTINRFTTNIKYNCNGIEQIMLDYFRNHFEFKSLTYFADRRWVINIENNIYTSIGFKVDSFINPSFTYYSPYTSKKKRLKEGEITDICNYTRIWDCGQVKYVYTNKAIE